MLKLLPKNEKFTELSRNLPHVFSRFLEAVAVLFKEEAAASVAAWELTAERLERVMF